MMHGANAPAALIPKSKRVPLLSRLHIKGIRRCRRDGRIIYIKFFVSTIQTSEYGHHNSPKIRTAPEERERRSLQQFQKPQSPPPTNPIATASSLVTTATSSLATAGPTGIAFEGGPDVNMDSEFRPAPAASTSSHKTTAPSTSHATSSTTTPQAARATPPLTYAQQREETIACNKRMVKRVMEPNVVERLEQLQKETGKNMLECYTMLEEEEAAVATASKIKPKPKPRPVKKNVPVAEKDKNRETR